MSVSIKSEKEIARMREAGKILSEVHDRLSEIIQPSITTKELDRRATEWIRSYGCTPSFLNYNGFPASLCTSINEEVIHGIPSKKRVLKEGDIISIDAGVIYQGYHSDAARTHAVGQISPEAKKLIAATKQSFFEGIKFARAGCHLFEISAAVEDYIVANGFSCVRDYVGHGVGAKLHEEPEVPNFHQSRRGMKLVSGMTLAIEPMVNIGKPDVYVLENDWTVVTEDHTLSAHYENTVLITEGEPEILSLQA